jgi:hypothetical protein
MPKLSALLPQHEDAWLAAMERYIRECLADAVLANACCRLPIARPKRDR